MDQEVYLVSPESKDGRFFLNKVVNGRKFPSPLRPMVAMKDGREEVFPSIRAAAMALGISDYKVAHSAKDLAKGATRAQVLSTTNFKVVDQVLPEISLSNTENTSMETKTADKPSYSLTVGSDMRPSLLKVGGRRASRPVAFTDRNGKMEVYAAVKDCLEGMKASTGAIYLLLKGEAAKNPKSALYGCKVRYATEEEIKKCSKWHIADYSVPAKQTKPAQEEETAKQSKPVLEEEPRKIVAQPLQPNKDYPEDLHSQGNDIDELRPLMRDIRILQSHELTLKLTVQGCGFDLVEDSELTDEVVNKICAALLESKKDRAFEITSRLQGALKDA